MADLLWDAAGWFFIGSMAAPNEAKAFALLRLATILGMGATGYVIGKKIKDDHPDIGYPADMVGIGAGAFGTWGSLVLLNRILNPPERDWSRDDARQRQRLGGGNAILTSGPIGRRTSRVTREMQEAYDKGQARLQAQEDLARATTVNPAYQPRRSETYSFASGVGRRV